MHSLEEGGVEVQCLEGQGVEVEGPGGQGSEVEEVGGEVPQAEVDSLELAGKVRSLEGRKDQLCFQPTCGTPCPQLLDQFKWMVVSFSFR